MTIRISLLLAFFILCVAGIVRAEIYKWVDENGRLHFSDRPPVQGEARPVETPPADEPFRSAQARAGMGKIIPIYADGHLRIRLIRETSDMLVFDVECFGMQNLFPDIAYERAVLMIGATAADRAENGPPSYLAMKLGFIETETASFLCEVKMSERTPDNYSTDKLNILLYQSDFERRPGSFRLQKEIAFEKVWKRS